ncbi:glycosyltransferase family 4 protein [Confluentibacter lentus]|uniref:glycosyltransferase family 4 protein n=1 Tax=Confluentibacter lentus TaxID=1699412 RepID=UPI000C2835A3|nr:glycosyltransferase family 4 protein [Confluentibacter lentus]
MKIHFIIGSLSIGGAQRVMILLANHFADKGHDVSIITFNEPNDFIPNQRVKHIKLHTDKIKNHTIRRIKILYCYYKKKNNRPDVMIPFITQINFIGIIVSKFFGIKIISSEHNNHLKKTDFIGKITKEYLYYFTDVLTVLTNHDVGFYKKRGVKVEVMPNPSTFEIFKEKTRNRENVILAVGDLDRYHHKGFDNLIPIIAPVLKKNPNWTLKIVGGGTMGLEFLETLAKQHDISHQVVFEGYSNEVQKIMRVSEIFIMTSRFEGLPMVLLEAMSQGMACISYDCFTGPSDIINDNVNGILVENQNQLAMQEKLNILINDKELRIKLSSNGIDSLDKFQIDIIYEKYLNIFHNILKI